MGINSMPRDGRNACLQLGFCFQGCKSGAKWSAGYSEIPKAEQTGNFELRTEAHVIQITHNKSGKIDGVVYVDKDGNQQKQKARIVAVAGNSIETPKIAFDVKFIDVSGWIIQLFWSGRKKLYETFNRISLCTNG